MEKTLQILSLWVLAFLRTPLTGKDIKSLSGRINRASEAELDWVAQHINLLTSCLAGGIEGWEIAGRSAITELSEPPSTKLFSSLGNWAKDFGQRAEKTVPEGTPSFLEAVETVMSGGELSEKAATTGDVIPEGTFDDRLEIDPELEEGTGVVQLDSLGDATPMAVVPLLTSKVGLDVAREAVHALPHRFDAMPEAQAQEMAEALGELRAEVTLFVA
tara:strand:+ start:297 stop:947 length:651 start_codon:yes stop_codon:yes gene_type:complete